jgi:hypothetical protein
VAFGHLGEWRQRQKELVMNQSWSKAREVSQKKEDIFSVWQHQVCCPF